MIERGRRKAQIAETVTRFLFLLVVVLFVGWAVVPPTSNKAVDVQTLRGAAKFQALLKWR